MRTLTSKTVNHVWVLSWRPYGTVGIEVEVFETEDDAGRARGFHGGEIQRVPIKITEDGEGDTRFAEREEAL